MSEEDETEFLEYARSLGNLLTLPATSPTSDFTPVFGFPEPSQEESTRGFWLQDAGAGRPLVRGDGPEKGYYLGDGFQSPVIEFCLSWTDSQILMPCAIQADMKYFHSDKP